MRTLISDEYNFLARIEAIISKDLHSLGLSKNALVTAMDDGGMGSLRFTSNTDASLKRRLGEVLVQGEFDDADGVIVSFAINLDNEGKLFELDLWRVDFLPVQRIASPGTEVRILSSAT